MKNIAIFFASNTGKTKKVADEISKDLENIKEYNIQVTGVDFMIDYENIILGISTYENGEMQEDWQHIWEEFCHIDFTGKSVAIFGLGDQLNYPNNFVDAMGTLYNQLIHAGANVIGFTSIEGYDFKKSYALEKNEFVGLVIDPENQGDLTVQRVETWVENLKKDFNR